ncbi:MAG: phosphotransferase family protein [Candidatus Eremiobacteraeota bacterium]|nr:phosphotransferase family protein [Candidatus Eremiobacteraeota bacterium]
MGRGCTIDRVELLSGGAIQQNWLLVGTVDAKPFAWVLRTDAASSLMMSHSRAQEFALLRVAEAAGVTVAKPLALCEDLSVLGTPFFVAQRASGTALASRVVKDLGLGGDRTKLGGILGAELARIHRIRPPEPELAFLPLPVRTAALDAVDSGRATLDELEVSRPVLEWGLRWLERNAPAASEIVLCHRDFRTGNYMLDARGVSAILDWEFAGWGDGAEDLGWFCAACWRFGRDDLEAGGVALRGDFYRGYERESGNRIDPDAVHYWEVAAHVRWAVIALLQADRHLRGAETSLELALTSHLVPELEYEILALTGGWR